MYLFTCFQVHLLKGVISCTTVIEIEKVELLSWKWNLATSNEVSVVLSVLVPKIIPGLAWVQAKQHHQIRTGNVNT